MAGNLSKKRLELKEEFFNGVNCTHKVSTNTSLFPL
jgi:hypothetical protein